MFVLYIYFFYISLFLTTNLGIESITNELERYNISKLEYENDLNNITSQKILFKSQMDENIQKLNEIENSSINSGDEVEINNLKNGINILYSLIESLENAEKIMFDNILMINIVIESAEKELSEKISENIESLNIN